MNLDFSQAHFASPVWLWLAVLGPVGLWLLQRYSAWRRNKQLARLAAKESLAALTRSHSPGKRLLKEALLVVAVGILGLALARPQWGVQVETTQLLDSDTVFVLDCSRSMLATDVNPNRLLRAKLAIMDYVSHHGRGRFGLVAFAGQAFLQCPLTFDYDAFEDTLLMVDDRTIPVPGTDLGRALQEGALALDKASRYKTLVLVTDGEDLEQSGVKVAEALAKQGVAVFTVGVGTVAGAEIHFLDEKGREQVVADKQGQFVQSRLDETTLRRIAQVSGGLYAPLGPLGEGLAQVRLAVESRVAAAEGTSTRTFGVERFHWPVAAALCLLVVESLMGTRRKLDDAQR